MKLQEIFDQLTYGELSQLAIGGGEEGKIAVKDYPKILAHINLGLIALYKRFPLKEGRVQVDLQPNQTQYSIHSSFGIGNRKSREPVRYIHDSITHPFMDDVMKIERVFTDKELEMPLNNSFDPWNVHTPTSTRIIVPNKLVDGTLDMGDDYYTKSLHLVYRANHPVLTIPVGLFEPTRVEVELPYTHLEPLLLFIASRINNPIGITNEFNAGNNYAAKYEVACKQLEVDNFKIDQGSQGNRLREKGFV